MKKKRFKTKYTNKYLYRHLISTQLLVGALITELDKKNLINGHDAIDNWQTHVDIFKEKLKR